MESRQKLQTINWTWCFLLICSTCCLISTVESHDTLSISQMVNQAKSKADSLVFLQERISQAMQKIEPNLVLTTLKQVSPLKKYLELILCNNVCLFDPIPNLILMIYFILIRWTSSLAQRLECLTLLLYQVIRC